RLFSGPTEIRGMMLAGRSALWARDADQLRAAIEGLRHGSIRGNWVMNMHRTLGAGLAAMEGKTEEAIARYEEVVHEWRDLGTQFDLAMAHLDRLTVLGLDAPGSD